MRPRLVPFLCLAVLTVVLFAWGPRPVAFAASPVTISYPDFSNTTGLQLNGSAFVLESGSALRLVSNSPFLNGSAFTTSTLDTRLSFESQFVFSFHNSDLETGYGPADGMTFTLQSSAPTALGEAGGNLGYGGINNITPSVAIGFNTYLDAGKPPVSVLTGGDAYTYPASDVPPFNLYGSPVHVWIDYAGTTHLLQVFASLTSTKPSGPALRYTYNIAAHIGESAYAGFTAATGNGDMDQDILNWKLTQSLPGCALDPNLDLSHTLLDNCNLTHAALSGANLNLASARGTLLRHALLSGVNATQADLTGAVLSDAIGSNATFASATLSGAHFERALLRNANFFNADLSGANLTGANLMNANLQQADLTHALLTGARLDGASLNGAAGLTAAALKGVRWFNTTCPDGSNTGARGTCIGHLTPGTLSVVAIY